MPATLIGCTGPPETIEVARHGFTGNSKTHRLTSPSSSSSSSASQKSQINLFGPSPSPPEVGPVSMELGSALSAL
ncbi:hypothetical protein CDL15_Pgr000785 [Punica granatum]|uniref:Uncharacterized protein n=1 Tax=Punica granatum TaxID=22663 RepID=A0A218W458_PUNGR|nr:hypothetical protein CDL15_Pgr000785 [Punica granatum]